MRSWAAFFLLLLLLFHVWGCALQTEESKQPIKSLDDISDKAIESISRKTIFFGHASVGYNIVQGMKEIIELDPRFKKINIIEIKENANIEGPGLYHSVNGKNSYPKTKCDSFEYFLIKRRFGDFVDVGLFKFCYVDIEKDSNVQEIFDYYVRTIEKIKMEYPKLKIIHVTAPLYAHAFGLKGFVKSMIKADMSNIKRNQFNELLKNKYAGVDPIYDLARVEYEKRNGEVSKFFYNGKMYHSLAEEYTNDGGHLNEIGRFRAAKEFIRVLSTI